MAGGLELVFGMSWGSQGVIWGAQGVCLKNVSGAWKFVSGAWNFVSGALEVCIGADLGGGLDLLPRVELVSGQMEKVGRVASGLEE